MSFARIIVLAALIGVSTAPPVAPALVAEESQGSGGGRVAFGSYESGAYNVYTAAPSGAALRLVAEDATDPVWSPDGRWLAYVAPFAALLRVRADGTRARRLAVDGRGAIYYPSWSPDSRWLSFTRMIPFINEEGDEDGRSYIYVVRRDGRRMRRLNRSFLEPSAWSPRDGTIVFGHRLGLAAIRPDGTRFRILRRDLTMSRLSFSPSGHHLAMTASSDQGPLIRVFDMRTRRLRTLTVLKGNIAAASTITWTPDGRRLAYLWDEYGTADGITRKVSTGLYTIRPDGTGSVRLATLPASAGLGGLSWAP